MSIFLVEASYWIHLQVEVFFWYKRTWLSIIFKNKEWIQNIFCANLSLMTSPGDSGGGCAGEAASLIQVDGTASSLWSCWWSGGMPLIRSNKKDFFRTVQTRRCHPAYGYPHALGLLHACTPTAGCSCSGPAVWLKCYGLSVPNPCDPAKRGRDDASFTMSIWVDKSGVLHSKSA